MKAILIVDGYSTGRYLASRLRTANPRHVLLHVQSSSRVPAELTNAFIPGDFDYDLGVFAPPFDLPSELASVEHVIAGSEPGVSLADELAHRWQCATRNVRGLSDCRRNKYAMQQAVSARGHRAAKTALVATIEEALELTKNTFSFPVVTKPPRSAGTDRVRVSRDASELESALRDTLQQFDKNGNYNEEAVLQEHLDGHEYCVSGLSVAGKHHFTDIWRYRKKSRHGVALYDCDELLETTAPDLHELLQYASDVLDAVGIRYGPSHIELIDTATGPCLVEVAARLQGGIDPEALELALGFDSLLLAASTFVDERRVVEHAWMRRDALALAPRQSALLCVHLLCNGDGTLHRHAAEQFLESLPTYYPASLHARFGPITTTVDLFTSPGFFYLADRDAGKIWRDYERFRDAEQSLYS